ncbi:hypothetical protein GN330_12125 [Nitratireductor sp. CAU 1489]|uniref:Uncharacterized protein n=1 Tax=Nitratireductor arenosus TaxID=2682096 RepID=A0A844QJ92_9HYPH|nr:hypothetical protein [Nitratireductor arenosus]MVA97991.1 hypothetical protein [Nitratireductor arenosus]
MLIASSIEPHLSRRPDVAQISHLTWSTRIKLIRAMQIGHAIKLMYAAPLRLALAFLFLLLTSVQPGLFSMASAKGLTATMPAEVTQVHTSHAVADHAHEGGHHAGVDSGHAQSKVQHHKGGKFAGGGCEVHCAPVTAVPVDCPFPQWPASSGHGAICIVALVDGETSVLAKPPRYLN